MPRSWRLPWRRATTPSPAVIASPLLDAPPKPVCSIFLMRHGIYASGSLTERSETQIGQAIDVLMLNGLGDLVILHSPSLRAAATADFVCQHLASVYERICHDEARSELGIHNGDPLESCRLHLLAYSAETTVILITHEDNLLTARANTPAVDRGPLEYGYGCLLRVMKTGALRQLDIGLTEH